ncbi:glycosyltransferase family 4 protein (plasmid) [Aliirhizobium terrae]|uniref:glycosyltransferase family 4 protein n=1 Tax=Terrirhizobium terrae TaxID=2926709 RepID=UPI0025770409|nr:glycosyltransferase family 4 protein [Rhizobium sp. CC-CFT758]WJH37650.1 glycosyltransferase family 4 protein [Rhizobium sp. CC-CFT758]
MQVLTGKDFDAAIDRSFDRRVLIIVENLPVPFDRRVWSEATTLRAAGYTVSVICPTGKGFEALYEEVDGIHIYRHPLPLDARGLLGYLREYSAALYHELRLAMKIRRTHGFHVIHGCNPPDLIFLIAWVFKPFGVKFLFDHHDICPELFEAKFGKRGFLYRMTRFFEKLTFRSAAISIATNASYRDIAVGRGGMDLDDVFIVRSGPKIEKLEIRPPKPALKKGFAHLVGYVGVIGQQEGMDLLVDAVDHIVNNLKRTDIHFGIVGGGPELPTIIRNVEARGLSQFFTFTGRASDDVMLDMLNTAEVCINPDRVTPMNDLSTMNKILEYMTLKKPIVQFETREGKVSAGAASLYATQNDARDFGEKIVSLLDDPLKRHVMGEVGRQRILSSFSWEHSAPVLLAAYERIFRTIEPVQTETIKDEPTYVADDKIRVRA